MRKHPLVSAMLMLGMTGNATALGLGELEVGSALFQPLQADIALHGWETISLENLRAALASEQAFLRANIPRPYLLRDLRMQVLRSGDGAFVRLTSRQPIREPMLEFLVDVEWPGGRLQRQYTILLDPPVVPGVARSTAGATRPGTAPTAEPTAAPAAPQEAATVAAPSVAAAAARAPTATVPGDAAAAGARERATYRVRRNDTLGAIAKQLRPDAGITLDQTMIALLEANPKAFVDRNINNLKHGALLQLPAREDMVALSPSQATAEVRRQYAAWREFRQSQRAQASAEAQPESALRLMPTVPDPVSAPIESTAVAESSLVEQELERTRELLYEREAELDVLRSRMAVYEAELQEMQSILREMREQQRAAVAQPAVAATAAAATPTAERSINITALLVALLLTLGGFGLFSFLFRRWRASAKSAAGASTTAVPLELNRELTMPEPIRPAPLDAVTEVAPALGEEAATHGTRRHTAVTELAPLSEHPTPTEVQDMVPDDAQTGDRMLIEADVLIQFGFFQRGYDLMNEALRADPSNNEYRLKLLELTHGLGDASEFEAQAKTLRDNLRPGQEAMWQRTCELGRSLDPDSALFQNRSKIEIGQAPANQPADATPTRGPEAVDENGEFVNLDEPGAADDKEWAFTAPAGDPLDDDQPTEEMPRIDGAAGTGEGQDAARTRDWRIPDEALQDPYLGEVLADAAQEQKAMRAVTRPWDAREVRDASDTEEWRSAGSARSRAVGPYGTHEYASAPSTPTDEAGDHDQNADSGETTEWSPTSEFTNLDREVGGVAMLDDDRTGEWRTDTGRCEAITEDFHHTGAGTTDAQRAGMPQSTGPHPSDDDASLPTQEWSHQSASASGAATSRWITADAASGDQPDDGATAPHPSAGGAAAQYDADATAEYLSAPGDTQQIEPLADPGATPDNGDGSGNDSASRRALERKG